MNTNTMLNLVPAKHPVLHEPAQLDPFQSDIDWAQTQSDMLALMRQRLGIGLAAPQVGLGYRMFVMQHSVLGDLGIYNPEILETSEQSLLMEEGCLSWPLLYLNIRRPNQILVRYSQHDETQVETWMSGIDARCFLHEKQHLDGINFIALVSDFKLRRALELRDKKLKKLQRSL